MNYRVENQLELFEFHDALFSPVSLDREKLIISAEYLNIHKNTRQNPFNYDMEIDYAQITFTNFRALSYKYASTETTDCNPPSFPFKIISGQEAQEKIFEELENQITVYDFDSIDGSRYFIDGCGIQAFFVMEFCFTDSNLNHTGIYLYSKGKIMIHLTFDYKTDEKCTTPGQYLKYHRTFQGLSTRELAEKVGIVPATLVLYENDRHPIKYSTAVALANVLGIDRNRLLDEYTAFVDYPYFSLLKKVRQDLSLTQIQMAELIGIGQTSYSGWEREIRVPRRKEYDKILAALKKLRVNVDTYLCQSASI